MELRRETAGINANGLKLIAILAMTVDHFAWILLPLELPGAEALHVIGRLAFPIMAYFIVEGFHHTRNAKRYLVRLLVLAVVSHFAYAFAFDHPYLFDFRRGIVDTTSVLWGLSLGLGALMIAHSAGVMPLCIAWLPRGGAYISLPSCWPFPCCTGTTARGETGRA